MCVILAFCLVGHLLDTNDKPKKKQKNCLSGLKNDDDDVIDIEQNWIIYAHVGFSVRSLPFSLL